MQIKDYYNILELPPSATLDEIKKSYRRLAHLYHPDKKGNDPYAAAQFAEIKEAYETLVHPHKKEVYLQQRWYAQSMGKKKAAVTVTPETLLKRMLELDRYVATLDIHRMDKEGMYHYLTYILSNENIQQLNSFNEPSVNQEIIYAALRSGNMIPFSLLDDFAARLNTINIAGVSANEPIKKFLHQRKQTHYWEKRKVWVILLTVIILCGIIFFLANN